MKRFVAVVLVGACAVEEPELSTDMMASTNTMFGLEVEAGSTVSAIRGTDPTAASAGAYLSIGAGGYSRFFQRMYDPAVVYSWVRVKASAATTLTVQANNVAAPTCNVPITPTWTWVECSFLVLDVGVAELRISATGAVDGFSRRRQPHVYIQSGRGAIVGNSVADASVPGAIH